MLANQRCRDSSQCRPPSPGLRRVATGICLSLARQQRHVGVARIAMQGIVTDKTVGETLLKRSAVDLDDSPLCHPPRLTEPRSGDDHIVEGTLLDVRHD